MKKLLICTTALVAAATTACAGGIDRSGQDISVIFEQGSVAQLSFSSVEPTVKGVFNHPLAGAIPSGKVSPAYSSFGLAMKVDLSEKLSMGVIVDQPWGADVAYVTPPYPLTGTSASVESTATTVLARYKINDSFSLHGGLRHVTVSGFYDPVGPYASTYANDSDTGYVVGAAFEKPEIAMRVALTYSSETSFALDGTVGDVTATMPQSVNLDFQTGIAADTLLFGQVRWADWASATIDDTLAGNLVSPSHDTITYSVGLGRKFTEKLSGAVTLGYEAAGGDTVSNLSPTDGFFSVGLGGTYTQGKMKISGGVRYVEVGDATTSAIGDFPGGEFAGNTALGVGVKVSFSF